MYTIEPLKTGISANQNSLETEQLARSLFFTFYLHCIKITVNQNPLFRKPDKLFIISKRFQLLYLTIFPPKTPLNQTV